MANDHPPTPPEKARKRTDADKATGAEPAAQSGYRVFISHAAADMDMAEALAADLDLPGLEDLAVEARFLDEVTQGKRPQISDYLLRYPERRDALLRMVMSLPPHERETPEQESGALETPPSALPGTAQALSEITARQARSRSGREWRMVAEERAGYSASRPPSSDSDAPTGSRAPGERERRDTDGPAGKGNTP